MEIGRDWNSTWKNMWPQESDVPGFKPFMLDFYQVSLLPLLFNTRYLKFLTYRRATNYTSA